MPRCLPLLLLAACSLPHLALGQTQVSGVRDLDFGAVVAGLTTQVSPSDPVKSGSFYIRYVAGGKIKVTLTIPSTLPRIGGGGSIPVSFRNGDAFVVSTAPGSNPNYFNPNGVSVSFLLAGAPDANVYLGGRVSPAAAAPAGNYSAPVIVTVVFF
jgi:hypothetical protein